MPNPPAARLFRSVPLALLLFAAAPAREYAAIKGESTLAYRIKSPLHIVNGITREFACTVDLSGDTASSQVKVSADVKTFESGNSSRDDRALEAIKAHEHPKVTFASDSVRKAGALWRIHGKLTLAGRTRPVDFSVVPKREDGGRIRITGEFAIRLSDFGVKPPSLMFVPSDDRLDLRFDLVARDD